jgi:hypothetical protein
MKAIYKIKRIGVEDFKPRDSYVKIRIDFEKNDKRDFVIKEYSLKTLNNPAALTNSIILDMKKKDKFIVEEESDDFLQNIFTQPVRDLEKNEEKILTFINTLTENYKKLKSLKNANDYMKLYDKMKISRMEF